MNIIFTKTDKPIKGGVLLQPLISLRGHKCECCGLTEWLNKPITLEVHHIDGDKKNNELDNLQLLCPTCHSYTNNYGSKNNVKDEISDETFFEAIKNSSSVRQALFSLNMSDAGGNYVRARRIMEQYNFSYPTKEHKEKYCPKCGKLISSTSNMCVTCHNISTRVVERPDRDKLKELIRNKPFTHIAKEYGVSDKAISKWCKNANLPSTKSEIKQYSDEEWEKI